jgi:hypothetical protein
MDWMVVLLVIRLLNLIVDWFLWLSDEWLIVWDFAVFELGCRLRVEYVEVYL